MAKKQTTQPRRLDAGVGAGFAAAARGLASSKSLFEQEKAKQGQQMFQAVLDPISQYNKTAQETTAKFLNEMSDDYQVELLPDQMKGEFTQFATETKQFINDNIKEASKYSSNPSSKQYIEAVKNIEKGKNALKYNFEDLKSYANYRANLIQRQKNGDVLIPDGGFGFGRINDVTSEVGYGNLKLTMDGTVYDDGKGESVRASKMAQGNFSNPNLGNDLTKAFVTNPLELANTKDMTEATARTLLTRNANTLFKTKNAQRQIAFLGIDGDPDTRYVDYYIMEQAAAGNPEFSDVKYIDRDGIDGVSKNDKIAGSWGLDEKSQQAFDAHVEKLKNDPNLDFGEGVKNFFVNMGMDQYAGATQEVAGSLFSDPNASLPLTTGGYNSARNIKYIIDQYNKGQATVNGKPYMQADDGIFYPKGADGKPIKETEEAVYDAETMLGALGVGSYMDEFAAPTQSTPTTVESTEELIPSTNPALAAALDASYPGWSGDTLRFYPFNVKEKLRDDYKKGLMDEAIVPWYEDQLNQIQTTAQVEALDSTAETPQTTQPKTEPEQRADTLVQAANKPNEKTKPYSTIDSRRAQRIGLAKQKIKRLEKKYTKEQLSRKVGVFEGRLFYNREATDVRAYQKAKEDLEFYKNAKDSEI